MQASVFISHSSLDKVFVYRLATEFHAIGVRTWIDDKQIKVGQRISRRIMDGVFSCDYFLIVLSRNSEKSNWVKHELESAYFEAVSKRKDVILPILLDNVPVPNELKNVKYADFRNGFEKGFKELVKIFELDEDYLEFLSREEREKEIKKLLNTTNKFGGVPEQVMLLVPDETYLYIFEDILNNEESNERTLYNATESLNWLANYSYDHRVIRSHSSIAPLINLFERTVNHKLRKDIIDALSSIGSKLCWDFITSKLESSNNSLRARILIGLSSMSSQEDYSNWDSKIIKFLHECTSFKEADCLYFDIESEENDYRFWVFRCLGLAKKKSSVKFIEKYLENKYEPLATQAEAAAAHWCITKSEKYISVLKKARRNRIGCSASVTLDEIKNKKSKLKK